MAWLTALVYPPPQARPRIVIWTVGFAIAITVMIALFAAAPVDVKAGSVTAFEVRATPAIPTSPGCSLRCI